eukprot:Nitzschia sp. Nitz4//NODE_159_length_47236_cov_74.723851//560//2759//NITZ4_additional_000001-RA//1//CDS//3329531722//5806//frame0
MKVATVGVDIGCTSTKVVLGLPSNNNDDVTYDIVRNEVGGHTTPTVVSFVDPKRRLIGVEANARPNKNTIPYLNRLLANEIESGDLLTTFMLPSLQLEECQVQGLTYQGESTSFSTPALLAMFLRKLQAHVQSTCSSSKDEPMEFRFLFSCPPALSDLARQQWLDAAYAAGMEHMSLVDRSVAYQAVYSRKFPSSGGQSVMIVDMGHAETTVSIMGSKTKEGGEEEAIPTTVPLACVRSKGLGAGAMDVRLWNHFAPTLKMDNVTPTSKAGQRLLTGMNKLKHLLSQLPTAQVTVEQEDRDVRIEGTRALLMELCGEEKAALVTLLRDAWKQAQSVVPLETLGSIELVGGGCRIPWVKDVILETVQGLLGADTTVSLAYSLDDTSAAMGVALSGGTDDASTFVSQLVINETNVASDVQKTLKEAEDVMASKDKEQQERAHFLNLMEERILALRSAQHGDKGSLLDPALFPYLDELEDWIFLPETIDNASYADIQAKWEQVQEKIASMSSAYQAALDAEKRKKEAELEKEAQLAKAEESEMDEEDHDNRRLPKKRRMEIVMKNKNEGGELFADGNYKFAAARYAKALSHCAKFVDLSPDDATEVKGVKLTLNLNLALAWIKMSNPDQALRYCNDALAIDDSNAKALYRRASVFYEKKQWEAAGKDLKKAAQAAPDDKAIGKLLEKVDAQKKREKAKQKKMAQKMFG